MQWTRSHLHVYVVQALGMSEDSQNQPRHHDHDSINNNRETIRPVNNHNRASILQSSSRRRNESFEGLSHTQNTFTRG